MFKVIIKSLLFTLLFCTILFPVALLVIAMCIIITPIALPIIIFMMVFNDLNNERKGLNETVSNRYF